MTLIKAFILHKNKCSFSEKVSLTTFFNKYGIMLVRNLQKGVEYVG